MLVGFPSLRWGFLYKCCAEGELSGKAEWGEQEGAGERVKWGCDLCWRLAAAWSHVAVCGCLERDLYHRVGHTVRQEDWPFVPPYESVIGCGLPQGVGGHNFLTEAVKKEAAIGFQWLCLRQLGDGWICLVKQVWAGPQQHPLGYRLVILSCKWSDSEYFSLAGLCYNYLALLLWHESSLR